jgi:hypothetical protein
VITGDVTQVDLPEGRKSGLSDATNLLAGTEGIAFCTFTDVDVVRHPLVARIVRAYDARDSRAEAAGAPCAKRTARRTSRKSMLRLAVVAMAMAGTASAQVRFRRPLGPAPVISYGYDNNGGAAGCRDYNCGSRCYDGHTGTDIPVPLGTTVLAGAAGTVVGDERRLRQLRRPRQHLRRALRQLRAAPALRRHPHDLLPHAAQLADGVAAGSPCAAVRPSGDRRASGSSTGPHLHFGWQRGGVSLDPFTGGCSNGGGRWVNQGSYPNSPGDSCEGPPPPPPCTRREGPFGWNCSGPIAGMTCTLINERRPAHLGRQLPLLGPRPGAALVVLGAHRGDALHRRQRVLEPAAHTWGDNYLCAPSWLPYTFRLPRRGDVVPIAHLGRQLLDPRPQLRAPRRALRVELLGAAAGDDLHAGRRVVRPAHLERYLCAERDRCDGPPRAPSRG